MKKAILILLVLMGCAAHNYDSFAQCLTDNGAKFYGAFWCPHCADQKELFGSSMKNVNYIECSLPDKSDQTEVCKQAKIEHYPTWEFADGSRVEGVETLQSLASRTNCSITK